MGVQGSGEAFTATLTSGATLTSEIDLGRYYSRIALMVPSSISGTDVRLQVAESTGGTFHNVYTGFQDSDTSPAIWQLASSVTDCCIAVPNNGRFYKVEATTAVVDGATFYLIGID